MGNARKVRWTPIGLAVMLVFTYPKTAEVLRVTITPTLPATAQKH